MSAATLLVRSSVVSALSARKANAFEGLSENLWLTISAAPEYTDGTNTWRIWSADYFTLNDAARYGVLIREAGAPGDAPGGGDQRAFDRAWVEAQGIVMPEEVLIPENADAFATVLEAQTPPATILMATSMPAGFTPVEIEL